MADKKLTVIIPFLNEKYEVENTLKSIIAHSSGEIEIMLINDGSDDGFDYRAVAVKYDVNYIENRKRLGVAASRDLGVESSQTPYFLFLDAHMRFYNNLWIQRIVSELENDKRTLLCCQTKILGMENGIAVEHTNRNIPFGACMDLQKGKGFLEPSWVYKTPVETVQSQTVPVVCVLGAGYACRKEYWQYLKGLEGLKYYGTDEPYISMKVWMEGGSCKLLRDVVIGHIYRSNVFPFNTNMQVRLFNRLFIAELFYPGRLKKTLHSIFKLFFESSFSESLLMLHDHRDQIDRLKQYYEKIFTRDFSFFEEMNHKYYIHNMSEKDVSVDNINTILESIVVRIRQQVVPETGLLNGRMGLIIFLFHYARFVNIEPTEAEMMLERLLQDIKNDTHYGFYTGLSGIGWGLEYLYQQGFLEGDSNEILEDFDRKIMEIDPRRICNLNKSCGLGGILLYLLIRLYSIEQENKPNPFDSEYLSDVYSRISHIIKQRDTTCDSIDIFMEFLTYYEHKEKIEKPDIYDVWSLLNPKNTFLQDLDLGLSGATGVGLHLILKNAEID